MSDDDPINGMGLCLSGGGYRATLFHLGSVWRLYEAGILQDIKCISSVSGGSITSAHLALTWKNLSFDAAKMNEDFIPQFINPVRELARQTIDRQAIGAGVLWFGTISEYVTAAYQKYLFGDATLQDLPDAPYFVINSTSLQSGALCRFSKPYIADYRIGMIENPKISVAQAVAASSAFPPVLSPCEIDTNPEDFKPGSGLDLQYGAFIDKLVLTDGGVYDNLGLEAVEKNYTQILVSDGGGQMSPEGDPSVDWARQSKRVLDVIDNQVRSLRKRNLISNYKSGDKSGAYWGIRSDIKKYRRTPDVTDDLIPADLTVTQDLANTPTRLKKLSDERQERLINWGYTICDAAIRKHLNPSIGKGVLPYPQYQLN